MGFIGFLLDLFGFASKLFSFFSNRDLQKQGAEAQTNKTNQVTAALETKIADSEAKTDKTVEGLIKSAEKGQF